MRRLWGLIGFIAIVGCSEGGRAQAPQTPRVNSPPDKLLQVAAPDPEPDQSVRIDL